MRTKDAILQEYREADLYKRLSLYLQYRDLRNQFTKIDSEERATPPHAEYSKRKASRLLTAAGTS